MKTETIFWVIKFDKSYKEVIYLEKEKTEKATKLQNVLQASICIQRHTLIDYETETYLKRFLSSVNKLVSLQLAALYK